MKLHLGVNDVPEFEGDKSLYDVAVSLEGRYGLFSNFVDMHHDDIEEDLVKSLNSQLTRIMAGQPMSEPFQEAVESIENKFQEYLTNEELAGKVAGVPTKMSIMNKSRIPSAKRRGKSFVDTGTLRTHIRVWMEE